jgi:type I restriction enzyme S subunit
MVLKPVVCNSKYLYSFINRYYSYINSKPKGTGTPHVNPDVFWKLLFPIAPLNEQKRIVAKLDAVIPRIAAVKERLEKIPTILKRFRQSVLTAAVTGKLTEKWRGDHSEVESAEVLLERIKAFRIENAKNNRDLNAITKNLKEGLERLQNKEAPYPLPDTWKYCEINSIGNVYNGSTPSRKVPAYWNGKINWVSSGEVSNTRIKSTREQISQDGFNNASVKLFPKGTVLVAMIGEGKTRGQTAILDIESTCNQNVAAILIDHGCVLPEYLFNWFLMNYERNRNFGSGSGPKALNCQRVREIDFILPPFQEQKEIVRQVDKLFALSDKVEIHYQKARDRVDKLSQSVLAKAFRGELVPQDPNDEPAEKLLERILEEKTKMEAELKGAVRQKRRAPKKNRSKSTSGVKMR